jgi:hypothetical protein
VLRKLGSGTTHGMAANPCSFQDDDLSYSPNMLVVADKKASNHKPIGFTMGPALARVDLNSVFIANLTTGPAVDHHLSEMPKSLSLQTALLLRKQLQLDVDGFTKELNSALDGKLVGYSYQMRKDGAVIHARSNGWARMQKDGDKHWSADTRMHVASISKLITAIALTRLLKDKNISVEDAIASYLPGYWRKGANVELITFSQLLTHRSGFDTRKDYSDYKFMMTRVARGVYYPNTNYPRRIDDYKPNVPEQTGIGTFAYQNMNFGLARILIPIKNGDLDKNASLTDDEWDEQTIKYYQEYVRRMVFLPSGAPGTHSRHSVSL